MKFLIGHKAFVPLCTTLPYIFISHVEHLSKIFYELLYPKMGAKGDWNFPISDLVKNPDGNDI